MPANLSTYFEAEYAKGRAAQDVIDEVVQGITKAAQEKFGAEYDIRTHIGEDFSVRLIQCLTVVENVQDEYREVSLENIRKVNPDAQIGTVFANSLEYDALDTPFGILQTGSTKLRNVNINQ